MLGHYSRLLSFCILLFFNTCNNETLCIPLMFLSLLTDLIFVLSFAFFFVNLCNNEPYVKSAQPSRHALQASITATSMLLTGANRRSIAMRSLRPKSAPRAFRARPLQPALPLLFLSKRHAAIRPVSTSNISKISKHICTLSFGQIFLDYYITHSSNETIGYPTVCSSQSFISFI